MKNSVYIWCFNNPISGHNAFNLLVSIKLADPHIDVNLIHDEVSISELSKEQLNYFKKTYQAIDEADMQYNLLNKINTEFVILLHSDMLFFNKPISQIFSKFFKTDFYMSYELIDRNVLDYSNMINKIQYKNYDNRLFYFKKSKLLNIQEASKNIDLDIKFFDKLCILLNNNDNNSNIGFIYNDVKLSESEIMQIFYGLDIKENNKNLIIKLLEVYQSKVVKIPQIQTTTLVNPLEYKQKIKIVKNKNIGFNLLIQYYKTSDERNKEILQAIKKNIENNLIKNIYVFIEKDAVLNIEHPKLVKIYSKRLTYKELIRQSNEKLLNEVVMIANSDIYYDNTLQHILNNSINDKWICLTRYDVLDNQLKFYNNKRSSDTWIFQTPIKEFGDFYMGIPHCDGRICQEAEKIGELSIINPSKSIISYHLHKSAERTQKQEIDYIYGEVYDVEVVSDTNQLSDRTEAFVGYQLPISIQGRNELINFYDNVFKNYKGYVVEVVDNPNLLSGCFVSPKQEIDVVCPNEKIIKKTYDVKVYECVISDTKKETEYYYNGNIGSTDIKYLNKLGIGSVNNKKLYCKKLNELINKKPDVLIINTNEMFDINIDFEYLICKKGIPMYNLLIDKYNMYNDGDVYGVFISKQNINVLERKQTTSKFNILTSISPKESEGQKLAIESQSKLDNVTIYSFNVLDEIKILKDLYKNIIFVDVDINDTEYKNTNKPLVKINTFLNFTKNFVNDTIFTIINSDIILNIDNCYIDWLCGAKEDCIYYANRINFNNSFNDLNDKYEYGIDMVVFNNTKIPYIYPDSSFCIGAPQQDYQILYHPIIKNINVYNITDNICYHKNHIVNQNKELQVKYGSLYYNDINGKYNDFANIKYEHIDKTGGHFIRNQLGIYKKNISSNLKVSIVYGRKAGLFSIFLQVLEALRTNPLVYVDLKSNFPYLVDKNNAWDYYFEQPHKLISSYKYIIEPNKPNGWILEPMTIENKERLRVYNEIYKHYIKYDKRVIDIFNDFYEKNMKGFKILAIHVRGTDIKESYNNIEFRKMNVSKKGIDDYFKCVDGHIHNYDKILVCTDEQKILDNFISKYKNKVIFYDSIRSKDGAPIHLSNNVNKFKAGQDVVVESLLMSVSDYFIHGFSNVAAAVKIYNINLETKNIDLI